MLWFQAGAGDFSRAGSKRRPAGLSIRVNRTSRCWFLAILLLSLVLGVSSLAPYASALVLPDFDAEGHLRGKFEAGTARRIDQEHVGFEQLKIYTYTPEDQPDLRIDMSTSVLDLKTRILSSKARTTIQRADFNIAGDSVEFDTNSKTGRLIGNVKMVITDKSHLTATPGPKE